MKDPLADATPEVGYQTVEWDMLKPPDERVMLLTYTNRLKLSEMSVWEDGDMTEYSVVDSVGNTYTEVDFDRVSDTPDPGQLDAVLTDIESETGKPRRVALARLAEMAAEAPEACADAVEPMVKLLSDSPPAVQGEALNVLTTVGESKPELTRAGVDLTVALLESATHPLLQNEAVQFLDMFAAHDPGAVTAAVPGLAALLGEVAPTAGEFLSAEEVPLRSNAAGVLADIAGEYPTKVKPWVPDAIELLDDPDEQVRHNATAILARVAAEHPDVVPPATEELLAVLDDDLANTRFNACWALNYVNATNTVDTLREIAATDPDTDVREVAQLVVDNLEE
ncbi:hypothetical protein C463_06297 [Halorubrum californiense DSM 19288]|uniref:Uncharacterized protein n=1 Tax=Halorubrum californiense DSM 19288 TaxID=1227465 RepID=M0EEQ6_9EURY|nr:MULTISPECIES: HEAT repeat domain-containing protein [Halorubrum]ELZ45508.1 hypothetical protein C463_06297 [Halorubrum californiense DSM 19288]TKX66130.1 hypothetical protein EXE40_16175 [Halorubrum sp. GN11GM_10-3_MGM]